MMGKNAIKATVVLMTVALLGLIGVQVYWINSAVKLRQQKFSYAVHEALGNVAYQYEKLKTAQSLAVQTGLMQKRQKLVAEMDSMNCAIGRTRDSLLQSYLDRKGNPNGVGDRVGRSQPFRHQNRFSANYPFSNPNHVEFQLGPQNSSFQISVHEEYLVDSGGTLVKRSREKHYMSPDRAEASGPEFPKSEYSEFMDSVKQLQNTNLKWLQQRAQMVNEIFDEMMNVDLSGRSDVIDTLALDSLLRQQFNDKGIEAEYAYGIFDPFMKAYYFNKGKEHLKGVLTSEHRVNLTPGNVFSQPRLLSVFFPNQQKYLLQTMWLLLTVSALFILVIIFSFSFTVSTIIRQKKVSEIKNDFINNMTHELKTPISTISLACQALNDPDIKSKKGIVENYVNVIADENKRLAMVVENVLRTAVMDKGELKLKITELDLHQVVDQVLQNMKLQISQRGGQFVTELLATETVVEADRVHLTNVLFNLIDNALKYTDKIPVIKIITKNTDDGVSISIQDNGIGIRKEHQKKIFDKLYRVPTGDIHNVKGFGLGLSYVKAIVDKHRGHIKLKSEPDKGSRFEIYIPFKQNES